MSARHREALIRDLAALCDEILAATAGRDVEDFLDDLDAVRAMERRLELVGEVATRLDDPPEAGISWDDLRGLRVLLAHAYHRVLPERLWMYATTDIPRLRGALGRDRRR